MDLNGSDAQAAFLWFLEHERERHIRDIEAIDRDIEGLKKLGVRFPDTPLDSFIRVPGVEYETNKEP